MGAVTKMRLANSDNDNDHSSCQLLEHKALTCPEGQSAWAEAPPWLAFSAMTGKTGTKDTDDNDTAWQLKRKELAWPEGCESHQCTKARDQLLFTSHVRDGSVIGARVRMEGVWVLAHVESAQESPQERAAGK